MKKFILLLLCMSFSICIFANERYHIKVLREISYQQAQTYERKWEISTYSYTVNGMNIHKKYYLFAEGIQHGSSIIIQNKKNGLPWEVRIDGRSYYASFEDEEELRVGDKGVLKYDGDRLYFYKY